LDDVLEALGSQPVPPDFHQTSADSSLFGSHHLSAEEHKEDPSINDNINNNESGSTPTTPLALHSASRDGRLSLSPVSPSATLRRNSYARKEGEHEHGRGNAVQSPASKDKLNKDKKKWKTLRDFVDDQGIEDVLEAIDQDRVALDVRFPFQVPSR
jgi:autophagy-related protein 17